MEVVSRMVKEMSSVSRMKSFAKVGEHMKYALLSVVLSVVSAVLARTDRVEVRPANTDEALINPGMGWCFYQYSGRMWAYGSTTPCGDTLDWFPGASVIYFRLPWCVLEPEEGVFRWDVIDAYAQPWIAKGKQIALRITCCESRFRYATPEWVRKAGCKGIDFQMPPVLGITPGNDDWLWEPDYTDPVFRAKLDRFLAALGRRYNGNPHVAFMDIGTLGMWGEGHTLFSRLRAKLPLLTDAQRDAIVTDQFRMWKKHLPDTMLLCVDDQAGDRNMAPDWPTLKLARELGFGFRDDSLMVGVPGGVPPRAWWHHGWARLFAPKAPVSIECEHYLLAKKRGSWNPDALMQAVVDHQASWLSIHGWPRAFYEENKDAIARVNKRLGYRFELRQASYSRSVEVGRRIEIASTWVNVGVAPFLREGVLAWSLLDAQDNVAWTFVDDAADFRAAAPTLEAGEKPMTVTSRPVFGYRADIPKFNDGVWLITEKDPPRPFGNQVPTLEKGVYRLAVSVGLRDGTPVVALPLFGGTGRRYPIGEITVR